MQGRFIRFLAAIVITAFFMVSCGSPNKEIAIYVAQDGNDDWLGDKDESNAMAYEGPVLSIQRAQELVREKLEEGTQEKAITVYIREGDYILPSPLTLTAADNGTAECPVTYRSYPGERVRIIGAQVISGWQKDADGVWTAKVPGATRGQMSFNQLFIGGERRIRARIPNDGYFMVDGPISKDPKAQFKYRGDDIKADWARQTGVEVIALQKWADFRMYIERIDSAKKIITLSRQCRPSNHENDARYWIENIREGLDNPGEWYLDTKTGTVSYIALPGENPNEKEAFMPYLTQLVRFEGKPEQGEYVENINLCDLEFLFSDWNIPSEGYADTQAAHTIPGVIFGEGAKSIRIENCTISHHGNYAVEFSRGCSNIQIVGCEMSDLGAGGVKIGECVTREDEREKTHHNTVTDNHIHDIGEVFSPACGVIIFRSGQNLIGHNHIHDTYYTGISNGWSWGYAETDTKENIIEFNHVHDIGRGMLSDMGGNYNLGLQPGTIIRNNYFHDISSYGYGGWGIYTDEGSTDILIENNVVHDTKSGGFHQHYGRENIIRNNIFVNAKQGQIIRTRMEEHISFTFERNIVYWTEGPLLGSNWKDDKYVLDYNCYFNTAGEPVMFKEWTFEEWQARGQDTHSVIADPMFTDPASHDYSLKAGSPAYDIGFLDIDLSTVGPRN